MHPQQQKMSGDPVMINNDTYELTNERWET